MSPIKFVKYIIKYSKIQNGRQGPFLFIILLVQQQSHV